MSSAPLASTHSHLRPFPRLTLRLGVCLAMIMSLASSGIAQDQPPDAATHPRRTFVVWSAGARNEPLNTRVGWTHDRDLYMVGLRGRWMLRGGANFKVAYTADLIPAVLSTGMPEYRDVLPPCPPSGPCVVPFLPQEVTRHAAYGAGAAPLGVELTLPATRRLAFLVRGSAGLAIFSRPIPDPGGNHLNFMFDACAAAEVRISRSTGLTAGYRLNHISNGGRSTVNTGMNSRMLEFGLTIAR
jgi:hypothetical protein